jgi:hypothetical protein
LGWHSNVFEVLDFRSFSSLWYWIAVAVMWSSASHWILGVPFDLVQRARRRGGQAADDMAQLAHINARRLLALAEASGTWLLGIGSALLTMLALLGFFYGLELAQALFFLALPMALLSLMSLSTARHIQAREMDTDMLGRRLARQRLWTQGLGVVSIFLTAIWGMYRILSTGVLGF